MWTGAHILEEDVIISQNKWSLDSFVTIPSTAKRLDFSSFNPLVQRSLRGHWSVAPGLSKRAQRQAGTDDLLVRVGFVSHLDKFGNQQTLCRAIVFTP
jgi:hypothetical protein